MKCTYDDTPATRIDLCHGPMPVCDDHVAVGHQYEVLPVEPGERRSRVARVPAAEVKAEAKQA